MLLTAFPYIAKPEAKILILGSMPGQKSLDEDQYYAHPRNAFWKIMASIYNFDLELTYQQRCQELTKNQIALWDVMKHCQRKGSLDSAILEDSIEANNFHAFLNSHPDITHIFFNGKKAEHSFKRYVLPDLNANLELTCLPSTSPAHTSMSFEEKMVIWKNAINLQDGQSLCRI